MMETVACGSTAQIEIRRLEGFALISQDNNASREELVYVPLTSIPSLIAALQRVAGEREKPAPAPADDGWVTCEAGECPTDLKVGDWIRRRSLNGDVEDAKITQIDGGVWPYRIGHSLWPSRENITAYRRSAP